VSQGVSEETETDAAAVAAATALDSAGRATALIESAPVAIYYVDHTGTLTYANPEYRRVFGLKPEHSPDDWAQGVHPDDRARMEAEWGDFCANPRPKQFAYRTVPRAGTVRYLTERVVRLGRTAGFVGIISDVTELQLHQTLLETLIANLPLALIACDADGNVTHYNREAAEMCTMGRESGAGSSPEYPVAAVIYHADGATPVERTDRPLARTLRGETVQNQEMVIVPRDSPARITLSNGRRMVGPNAQLMGAVVVTQDITERRRAELELERVHEQLRAAARQAGMAEVATSVLHNVGNVLTSINVSATLLAELVRRSKAPDLRRVAGLLQAQGEHLAQFITTDERGKLIPKYLEVLGEQLVKDVNAALEHLASLQRNLEHVKSTVAMQQNYAKLTCVNETVNALDLIEDAVRLNASAFTRHNIELRREFTPVPPITVDKHKVLQILVNLIRNAKWACDESDRKDKQLTLRVERDVSAVRICVIDNGVGIAPESMSRLFSHGFTTRRAGHGFGLHSGAIAAQELGGSLRAESQGLGHGAAFILELPLATS